MVECELFEISHLIKASVVFKLTCRDASRARVMPAGLSRDAIDAALAPDAEDTDASTEAGKTEAIEASVRRAVAALTAEH
jgi:hypothetical protein